MVHLVLILSMYSRHLYLSILLYGLYFPLYLLKCFGRQKQNKTILKPHVNILKHSVSILTPSFLNQKYAVLPFTEDKGYYTTLFVCGNIPLIIQVAISHFSLFHVSFMLSVPYFSSNNYTSIRNNSSTVIRTSLTIVGINNCHGFIL